MKVISWIPLRNTGTCTCHKDTIGIMIIFTGHNSGGVGVKFLGTFVVPDDLRPRVRILRVRFPRTKTDWSRTNWSSPLRTREK